MTPGLGGRGYATLRQSLAENGSDLEDFINLPRARQRVLWQKAAALAQQISRTRILFPSFDLFPTAQATHVANEALLAMHCRWIGSEDSRYPRRMLSDLTPNPPVLFYLGDLSLLDRHPTVGIIGTKSPSRAGASIARSLGRALAESGWMIVSGLARGCDQAGHRGALEVGGATVAFIPQGMLTLEMPPLLREFATLDNFLIISTWPPDAPWSGSLAVRRDVQIADTSDGVIAVEMNIRGGGTKYTVDFARERSRPVWTVQYPRVPRQAAGNPWLIQTGAQPIMIDENNQITPPSLRTLITQLKKASTQAKKRMRVMQMEMF